MYINGVKCDVCDTLHNSDGRLVVGELPKGWLVLSKAQDEELHFCSLECLRLWIPKHPVASEFAGQDEEPKVTLSDRVY